MSALWAGADQDGRAPVTPRGRRKVQLGPDRWVSPERVGQLMRRLQQRVVTACVDLAIDAHTPTRPAPERF